MNRDEQNGPKKIHPPQSSPDRALKTLSDVVGGGDHWRASDAAMLVSQKRDGRPEGGWVYWNVLNDVMYARQQPALMKAIEAREWGHAALLSTLPVFTLWRLTKGMYEFEPELLEALTGSEVNHLPTSLLTRLPEYAPYISLGSQRYSLGGNDVSGFWVALATFQDGSRSLQVVLRASDGKHFMPHVLELVGETLESALEATHNKLAAQEASLQKRKAEFGYKAHEPLVVRRTPQDEANDRELWSTVLALTLYLCSDEPDLNGVVRGDPELGKARHHGHRWYVPEQSGLVQVGLKYAGAIRMWKDPLERLPQSDTSGLGMPKAPHVRKAHWHLYWVGKGRQEPHVKWLQPVLVNVRVSMDDFPVSYRPVLGEPE